MSYLSDAPTVIRPATLAFAGNDTKPLLFQEWLAVLPAENMTTEPLFIAYYIAATIAGM